ncbi:DUF3794 and LysM peptidoglycan-binding domain-containing protein [Zongyangia hominis]|uniref:DUF3794 and LysM peptidoglycan-binding domain-containing protein n=1 Tax=Zongyangia hominis TaxID=2763677 RepID=UPI0021CCA6DE|nr:DUF3794 domain-containing protein [Zongyangia hominis]
MKVTKQAVTINEVVLETTLEQSLECDIVLADYYPDILRILKCEICPKIVQTNVGGERLTIDGFVNVMVYYLSDNSQIRCCEHKINLNKSCDLKTTAENPVVTVRPRVDYANCRAVNQRRLDVRGAVSLMVKVTAPREEQFMEDAEGGGIQLCRRSFDATDLVGCVSRQFSIEEELELSQGKPPIASIIRCELCANTTDYKVITGKIVAKGELMIHTLYAAEEDPRPQVMENTIPISQIIDMPGVDEDCKCDVRFEPISWDMQPQSDIDGEARIIDADVTLCVTAKAYRQNTVTAVSDAYSTSSVVKPSFSPISMMQLSDVIAEKSLVKASLDLDEDLSAIMDLWGRLEIISCKPGEGCVAVSAKLTVCLFAMNAQNEPVYIERAADVNENISQQNVPMSPVCELDAAVLSSAYTLSPRKVEVRCDVKFMGCVYDMVKQQLLTDIEVAGEKEKPADDSALTIYYADESEDIWDIAKRYNTSVQAVMEENSLEDEKLKKRGMILIPILD